ncbi:unnamed protein product [Sphagnum jensenii]|uniref:Uncharacterized protein n=1 Tax=Sphagnum jensenii TaxID=128206 RepID=A0ABP1AVR3_9BRYO
MVVPGSSFSQPLRLLPPLCCVNQTSALSIALLPSCITRISGSSAQQAPTIMSFFTIPSSFFLRSFASAAASSNPLASLARPCVCSRLCCYCHRNPRPEDRDLVSKSLTSEWLPLLLSFAADSRPFSLTKAIFTSHRKDGGASFLPSGRASLPSGQFPSLCNVMQQTR